MIHSNDPAFGLVGDGTIMGSKNFQKFISAARNQQAILLAGTYIAPQGGFTYPSGMKLVGEGVAATKVFRSPMDSANDLMAINADLPLDAQGNISMDPKLRKCADVTFAGFEMVGHDLMEVTNNMIAGIGIDGISFIGMRFANWRRTMLAWNNCDDINVEKTKFDNWGSLTEVPEPGKCLYDGGYAMWISETNSNVRVACCKSTRGEWTTLLLNTNGKVIYNDFESKEANIFGGPIDSLIHGNTFRNAFTKDCSGTNVEIGGRGNKITDNDFLGAGHGNLYLTSSQDTIVSENRLKNCNRQVPASALVGSTGAITLTNNPAGSGIGQKAKNVVIEGNQCFADEGNGTYAVAVYDFGGGPINDVRVTGNQWGPIAQWKGGPLRAPVSVQGKNFIVASNF